MRISEHHFTNSEMILFSKTFLFIFICLALAVVPFGEEYFNDFDGKDKAETDAQTNVGNTEPPRRAGQETILYDSDEDSYSDEEELKQINTNTENTTTSDTTEHNIQTNLTINTTQDKVKYPQHDEYFYVFSEDEEGSVLRQESDRQVYEPRAYNRSDDLADLFLSVQPFKPPPLNMKKEHKLKPPKTSWYSPFNYPCWRLPLLTGIPIKNKNSEVFQLPTAGLKHVMTEKDYVRNYTISRTKRKPNKWCHTMPCYADHTLCMYSTNMNSRICGDNYQVLELSNELQRNLVNTINAMRNEVATGQSVLYYRLPKAANMEQMIYDRDLQRISMAWLRQCLPGPARCASLNDESVTQLECTKSAAQCCHHSDQKYTNKTCIPKPECFVSTIHGCLHKWFDSAGSHLQVKDINCGRIRVETANTVQLLWARTSLVGCAYGRHDSGDVRLICSFAPGAPYTISADYYCGILRTSSINTTYDVVDFTDLDFISNILNIHFINMDIPFNGTVTGAPDDDSNTTTNFPTSRMASWGVDSLAAIYQHGWPIRGREKMNGSLAYEAKLVVKYNFREEDSNVLCDGTDSIYEVGETASLCPQTGWRFRGLCYDYRDAAPGYRLVAVLAPVAIFTLILYDLFNGVVRQANY